MIGEFFFLVLTSERANSCRLWTERPDGLNEGHAPGYRPNDALAIELDQPMASFSGQGSVSEDPALPCTWPGCHRRFSRKGDLSRHVQGTHRKIKPFVCPAAGCFKKQQRTTFARRDKLVDHLFAVHDYTTPCCCPRDGCDKIPRRMDEIYVHIRKCGNIDNTDTLRPLRLSLDKVCGTLDRIHPCPIASCKSRSRASDFPGHILRHEQKDIESAQAVLESNNWMVLKASCSHHNSRAGQSSCTCPITTLHVRCPVCHFIMEYSCFEDHMVLEHLIDDAHRDHFAFWRAHCRLLHVDTAWAVGTWGVDSQLANKGVQCPVCSCTSTSTRLDHHLGMMRCFSYLKPYRLQILRLYPGFLSERFFQAVWDDLENPLGPPGSIEAGPSNTQQPAALTRG